MQGSHNIIGVLDVLDGRRLRVRQHRCVRVRNRNATCSRCADACTSGCISFYGNVIVVTPEKCIGCGTCATACPTCALEVELPNDTELSRRAIAAMRANGGTAVVATERTLMDHEGDYRPELVVPVVCLGRVDEALIVSLVDAGAREVVLVAPHGPSPAEAKGIEMAEAVCSCANEILGAWGCDCRATVVGSLPKEVRADGLAAGWDRGPDAPLGNGRDAEEPRDGVDRSDAAANCSEGPEGESTENPMASFMHVMDDGTLPHFVPDRRERILDLLANIGSPADTYLDTRLWGHVEIDMDVCRGCRMCATFCPTGAINKFVDEDGVSGIEHTPCDCVQCRCCEDVCLTGAIAVSNEVWAPDLLSGAADRYEMPPEELVRSNPHSTVRAMRSILGTEMVFE